MNYDELYGHKVFTDELEAQIVLLHERVVQLAGDMRAIRDELARISEGHLEGIRLPVHADDWPEDPIGKAYAR